ncbi:MAG: 50S ribosomal protein L21 [Candidatus Aminicenantes bacterium]|nr:50S ribosomal protein L21 [Candidatus Aminicenantes bacterium]MDH5714771.1 50S ribosomal protein L21 [Candidatus Aminicenantes bacterium]
MYAVVSSGGKQYKISVGDVIKLEKLPQGVGEKVEFTDVFMVCTDDKEVKVGNPLVKNAKVIGSVVSEEKDKKVIVFKKKRRKGYRRTRGHRQWHSLVRIEQIVA